MSKVEEFASKEWSDLGFCNNEQSNAFKLGYLKGYRQAEKDVTESFARIIRGNLSMIDPKVQTKFEQLYTDITGEKMYKGFKD